MTEKKSGTSTYVQAIAAVQHAIDRYDPSVIGTRGYMELKAVKRI